MLTVRFHRWLCLWQNESVPILCDGPLMWSGPQDGKKAKWQLKWQFQSNHAAYEDVLELTTSEHISPQTWSCAVGSFHVRHVPAKECAFHGVSDVLLISSVPSASITFTGTICGHSMPIGNIQVPPDVQVVKNQQVQVFWAKTG